MLSCVAIYAIRKTSSLPKTLKTLLLSLAVSDVGVGLLGQPFYISLLVMWLQQSDPGCSTHKALFMVSSFFCLASFFGVVALSVDRFLAIQLHLRYQELVTHERVVSVVILIWVFTGLIVSITKFSNVIGSPRAYLSRNWRAITWVSNYSNRTPVIGHPRDRAPIT